MRVLPYWTNRAVLYDCNICFLPVFGLIRQFPPQQRPNNGLLMSFQYYCIIKDVTVCSGRCQTFISRRPRMGRNFVHNIITYQNIFPANMMCVCLSRQWEIYISAQASESLTVMHKLGPISMSLALKDARRASLAKSHTLVTHAYV